MADIRYNISGYTNDSNKKTVLEMIERALSGGEYMIILSNATPGFVGMDEFLANCAGDSDEPADGAEPSGSASNANNADDINECCVNVAPPSAAETTEGGQQEQEYQYTPIEALITLTSDQIQLLRNAGINFVEQAAILEEEDYRFGGNEELWNNYLGIKAAVALWEKENPHYGMIFSAEITDNAKQDCRNNG